MFTGIIKAVSKITDTEERDGSVFFTIEKTKGWKIHPGDSISTDGVCLTVKKIEKNSYVTELMTETLKKTKFSKVIPPYVNLEQSMKLTDLLDGHLVQGHVDCVGKIIDIKKGERDKTYTFQYPKEFSLYVVSKGSIAVDGISLTVVDAIKNTFSVWFVDYTLTHTTIGEKNIGDLVNLEFDIFAKYIARIIEKRK